MAAAAVEARGPAEAWVERLARDGLREEMLRGPAPDRFTRAWMSRFADESLEERPELAETVARALLAFSALDRDQGIDRDERVASALLTLSSARRRAGALEETAQLHAAIHEVLPHGSIDPGVDARFLEEEAELLAARGDYAGALEKARRALRILSEPYFADGPREHLLRRIASWTGELR